MITTDSNDSLVNMSGVEYPKQNFCGLNVSWHNLSVWVRKKNVEKSTWYSTRYFDCKILRKVSGIAEPGRILAIMGPSGAGKTTLLATISQRLIGDFKGKILVNGKQISKPLMLKVSGFVPQHDLVLESLTAFEHLQLMARLKLDRDVSVKERHEKIIAVMTELGLMSVKNSRISKMSGGEKKRLSMAVQLLTDPAILFCDEPTTGLDSFSAFSVVEQLKTLARNGKTVVCTIHQPASGLFEMFDSIYFLVEGGRMALSCETNEVTEYFNTIGIVCPETYNLAEFLVNQLALREDAESQLRINKICREYKSSGHYEKLLKKLELEVVKGKNFKIEVTEDTNSICQPKNDFSKYLSMKQPRKVTQLGWLLWRSGLDMVRNPQQHLIRLLFYLCMAVVVSTPYTGLEISQEGIQNIQGFLYLVIVETTFMFTYSVVHTFPAEIPILLREVDNGIYSPGPYYISKMIILLPRSIIEPIIYAAIMFLIPGLYEGLQSFIVFCIPVVACSITATAYGCLISAVFDGVAKGSMFSVPFEQVCLLFCGIYLSLSDVPFHFAWVKYVSIFYYGLEALSIWQWTQVDHIPCSLNRNLTCISTGNGVLNSYGYKESHFALDLGGLAFIYIVCHTIGFLALWKRSKHQAAY